MNDHHKLKHFFVLFKFQPAANWILKLIELVTATQNKEAKKLENAKNVSAEKTTTLAPRMSPFGRGIVPGDGPTSRSMEKGNPAFHGIRVRPYGTANTFVKYDEALLNVGNGLNITTGLFTAPFRGIYFFSFSATKQWGQENMSVVLKHNNMTISTRTISTGKETAGNMEWLSVNLQATLRMEAGDIVGIYTTLGLLYDIHPLLGPFNDIGNITKETAGRYTVFTGFTLQKL